MSFKVMEQNGNWAVVQDSDAISIAGGASIPYSLYKELRTQPHKAGERFVRDKHGRLVAKPTKKDVN